MGMYEFLSTTRRAYVYRLDAFGRLFTIPCRVEMLEAIYY
jgi:hypothetical protein